MSRQKIYLVGESMFAESLSTLLGEEEMQLAVTRFDNVRQTLAVLDSNLPDVIIMVDQDLVNLDYSDGLDMLWSDLPVIWANIGDDYLRLLSCRRVRPTRDDLLQALEALRHSE